MRIRIVGRGELSADLTAALRRPGVEILGYVADDRLLEEYARCVALLVPSPLGRQSPTRVLDAFRRGIPVIAHAANQGALHEMADQRNCILAGNGESFAAALRHAIANPAFMESLAKRAREEFETLYCVDHFSEFVISAASRENNEAGHRRHFDQPT
jgi:glycosyltransferase involved in cell wall biosynthesis